ncbi:MAG TPA: N-acetylmuramic acid 6-phosphate etherase [Pseudonocardia sp.]|uniref:N-acetylmuramic acid 6-phosphate etherase n=1 Tax=Pseudonocardia sp. TaxID=60912 RepID=UPI002F3F611E
MIDLGRLATERSRPELADLDTRSSAALVELMIGEDADVVAAVRAANGPIAAAVDLIVDRVGRGGRMIYVGAGTAGRLAVLDAAELGPTYRAGPDSVLALLAGGPEAMTAAVEGAEDDRGAARRDLAGLAPGPDDVVVGISASGRTPYALAALRAARAAGAATVGIANNPGTQLGALADVAIELLTGPEIVAGSTRMKAGTSQKLVLTTLSTAVMIRLGKVYRNLMVDVEVSNEKLHVRAVRIVSEATGAEPGQAAAALAAAEGRSKVAIVMLLAGVDAAPAGELLARSGGRIRAALHAGVGTS